MKNPKEMKDDELRETLQKAKEWVRRMRLELERRKQPHRGRLTRGLSTLGY